MMAVYRFLIRYYWLMAIFWLVLFVAIEAAPGTTDPQRHFLFWLAFWLLALPATMVVYFGSRQRAKEFTPPADVPIAFSEKRVTGHSNTSKLASFLMIKRSLIVEVAAETIYIRPMPYRSERGDLYKEFHRIPVRDVVLAQKTGNQLRLTWSGETSGDFTLMLSNPDAFLQSIHRTSLGTPLAY